MSGLDYAQRKALRRLGRGQTINRTMRNDPVIRECYSTEHYIYPPREMNIAEWCDWEAKARHPNGHWHQVTEWNPGPNPFRPGKRLGREERIIRRLVGPTETVGDLV